MAKRARSSSPCEPRWATPRSPDRPTLGPAVAAVAEKLGQPLMPWQRQVADVGLELLPDGRPAYRTVRLAVPRQSGKTTLILGWEIQRALGWAQTLGAAQRIVYSAQTGNDARKKLIEDQVPILERPKVKKLISIRQILKGMGNEAVVWANGSRLVLLASSEDSGHGKTVDLAIKDEMFADTDDRRDQALIPAMITKDYAQVVEASTMGTADSIPWNAGVDLGRSMVDRGAREGVAYFEWSALPTDDPEDPATWRRCMPALGLTQSEAAIRHAFTTMKLDEFRRAFLNITSASEERVIPQASWDLCCTSDDFDRTADVLGIDTNPERSASSIVACGNVDGVPHLEVIEYKPRTDWLVDRAVELARQYRAPLAVDMKGPAGQFVADIRRTDRSLRIIEVTSDQLPAACGEIYDRIVNQKIRIRRDEDLDGAAAGAAKRVVGDRWAFVRKSSKADICPLMAATVALWGVEHDSTTKTPGVGGAYDEDRYAAELVAIEEDEARAMALLDQ